MPGFLSDLSSHHEISGLFLFPNNQNKRRTQNEFLDFLQDSMLHSLTYGNYQSNYSISFKIEVCYEN